MNIEFYKEDVKRIFKENNLTYEWCVSFDGTIFVNVIWGDWKHDHGFLKYVMRKNHYQVISQVVTEENGDDAFSAEYKFIYMNDEL